MRVAIVVLAMELIAQLGSKKLSKVWNITEASEGGGALLLLHLNLKMNI